MKMKICTVLVTALILCFSILALSAYAYTDTAGNDHEYAIDVLSAIGLVGGNSNGEFGVDKDITRAEMAKLLYILYNKDIVPEAVTEDVYSDIPANHWAAPYVKWCSSKGIIGGYGDGTFRPGYNVTYDQALKMVCVTLGYTDFDSSLWPVDVRRKALIELGLGEGMPSALNGGDIINRAQICQLIYNALFADMNETKIEQVYIDGTIINVEVPKVLAIDVWSFKEETYEIVSVEDEYIEIQRIDDYGFPIDGYTTYMSLDDLGLSEYEYRTYDLLGLNIKTLVGADGRLLCDAIIIGRVIDNVSFEYTADRKAIIINGVEYTYENFDGRDIDEMFFANDVPVFAQMDGETSSEDRKGLLTKQFIVDFAKKSKVVRITDYNGDGKIDSFGIYPKSAYKVVSISNGKDAAGNTTKFINYTTLDGMGVPYRIDIKDVSIELKKDDVFVGAKVGYKMFAELVEPVETYAVKLSPSDGLVTLANGVTAKYSNHSVNGISAIALSFTALGEKNVAIYYIYNDEVIQSESKAAIVEYDFAVLVNIEESADTSFNPETMRDEAKYIATVRSFTNGKMVETQIVLNDALAGVVNGVSYTAREMQAMYGCGVNTDGMRVYNYTLISYLEEDDDGYTIHINNNLNPEEYVIIPAGASIEYDKSIGLYKIGTYNCVDIDDNAKVFYKYEITSGVAYGFIDLGCCYGANIYNSYLPLITAGETYLKRNDDGVYVLLATLFDRKAEHDHTFGQWIESVAPTCTQNGKRYKECTGCFTRKTEIISPIGHSVEAYHTIVDATCTEDGYKQGRCTNCNEQITETLLAKGHSFSAATIDWELRVSKRTCVCGLEVTNDIDYSYAVLRNVTREEGGFNPTTMMTVYYYIAELVIGDEQYEVKLNEGTAGIVNGSTLTASQMYDMYKYGVDNTGVVQYNYTPVRLVEYTNDGYVLHIGEALNEGDVLIPAGATLSYNPITKMYQLSDGNQIISKIALDNESKVYYNYVKAQTTHLYLGYYDKYSICEEAFSSMTVADSYLEPYPGTRNAYILKSTILRDEIVGVEDAVTTYNNDGRLIMYAYNNSWIEYIDGKLYNSYFFKNIVTGEVVEVEKTEYDKQANPGVIESALYGYDPVVEKYIRISEYSELDTIEVATLEDVISSYGLIFYNGGQAAVLSDDAVIWTQTGPCGGRTELTIEELENRFSEIEDYNNSIAEYGGAPLQIRMLLIKHRTEDDEYQIDAVIVENFAFDEDGIPYSNGSALIDSYFDMVGGFDEHTFGEWTTQEGSCTEDGFMVRECIVCGETEKKTFTAEGHSYTVTEFELTCEEDGYTLHHCDVCGHEYQDNVVKATGHDYGDWVTVKEPTETETGLARSECSKCDAYKTQVLEVSVKTQATAKLSSVTAKPGETVRLTLSVDALTEINSIAFSKFEFDTSVLEFIGFADYEGIEEDAIISVFDDSKGTILIGFENDIIFSGDICTLEFIVNPDATDCIADITFNTVIKRDSEVIGVDAEYSEVNVITYIIGDIEMDGDLDLDDAVYLFGNSMIPDYYPVEYPGNMDFTNDGFVNLKDAIALFNHSMLPDVYPLG